MLFRSIRNSFASIESKCIPQTGVVWHSSQSRKGTYPGSHGWPVCQYTVGCVKRSATHLCGSACNHGALRFASRTLRESKNHKLASRFPGSLTPGVKCFHARLAESIDVRASFFQRGHHVGECYSAKKQAIPTRRRENSRIVLDGLRRRG